jgi:methylated-DNA-protein-cysteine methyltransferase-like protein
MPSSREDFFERVWDVVRRVPPGRVTTYGLVARHLGVGRGARAVGWALQAVARSDDPLRVPCHRVVNREGALTGRRHFETPTVMEERLRAEGVAFTDDGHVDIERHAWNPAAPDAPTVQPPPAPVQPER